jgi:hypothetical protein
MDIKTSLRQLASRNIRFLQDAQTFEEYEKIMRHTNHLRKLALKLKYRDIEKMISAVVWETLLRLQKINIDKFKNKGKR